MKKIAGRYWLSAIAHAKSLERPVFNIGFVMIDNVIYLLYHIKIILFTLGAPPRD